MSHVSTLAIQVSDVDAFEAACRECGVELRREQKTFKTYGGTRNPCDMAVVDVSNPNAYEIGLVRTADGRYEVKTDEWGRSGGLKEKVGENAGRLLQHYGISAAKRVAQKQGMHVHEQRLPDGRIRLVCEPRQQQATASAGGWGGSGY
jgi:hypothetical protein